MFYIIFNIQNMKSVNENENMQKKLVSDEFTKLHCSSILYLHRIYIELSMIKNLKKKSIINLYLNYRNESGFSTRMTFSKKLRCSCHSGSRKSENVKICLLG